MVHFKKMWDDVCNILINDEIDDLEILETFNTGFIVKGNDEAEFITKDDFVDFWCHMLCFKKVTEMEIEENGKNRHKYICDIVKNLPYIDDSNGVITLTE